MQQGDKKMKYQKLSNDVSKLNNDLIDFIYLIYLNKIGSNACDNVNQIYGMELKQDLIDDNTEEKDLSKFNAKDKYFVFLNDQENHVVSGNNLYSLLNDKDDFLQFILNYKDLILKELKDMILKGYLLGLLKDIAKLKLLLKEN